MFNSIEETTQKIINENKQRICECIVDTFLEELICLMLLVRDRLEREKPGKWTEKKIYEQVRKILKGKDAP